jgi:uncharacterized repeat protein (TIGR03803 family)
MSRNKITETLSAVLIVIAALLAAAPGAWAQSKYKTLHQFNGTDGSRPYGGLTLDQAGNLYGTTGAGGAYGYGTVFELTPNKDGSWSEHVLHSFSDRPDGSGPLGGVIFDAAGNLYGTTSSGGSDEGGAVYELKHANGGWKESILYSFAMLLHDGLAPSAGVIFDSLGNLYGTTVGGGAYNIGTVFELTPGSGGTWTEQVLYNFPGGDNGSYPQTPVILDPMGNLYGMTTRGGRDNVGVVYKLTPARGTWTISVVHSFTGGHDGGSPMFGSLTMDAAGNLYGMTSAGGVFGYGAAFRLSQSTDKWKETLIHSFTNADGGLPYGGLTFDAAGNLFGTTEYGGDLKLCSGNGCGVVFKLARNSNGGWTETALRRFVDNQGANPVAGVILDSSGNLYGTTLGDGKKTFGSVFEITP